MFMKHGYIITNVTNEVILTVAESAGVALRVAHALEVELDSPVNIHSVSEFNKRFMLLTTGKTPVLSES
jgi:hypothetical protein